MVNAVFTALSTYFLCMLKLPQSVIKHIDKYIKHCLWRGSNINAKRPLQAAWQLACKPRNQGGLGVLNLTKHNEALLMKSLHKVLNRHNLPWVHMVWNNHYKDGMVSSSRKIGSFWWRDILKTLEHSKKSPELLLQMGAQCNYGQTYGTRRKTQLIQNFSHTP